MANSTRLAIGIILLWLSGLALFVAFHPGGVTLADGKQAGNPADVLRYLINEAGKLGTGQ